MSIPSRDEAIAILKEEGCGTGVIDHCINVTKIAMRIAKAYRAKGFHVEMRLVEIGSMLHDIGRGRTHGIEHGAVGGQIARGRGLNIAIVRIIERHVGAGLTLEEAHKYKLPKGAYIPLTLEEKIVCYADKLLVGEKEVGIGPTIEKLVLELGDKHPAIRRHKTLHEEITSVIGST